jgi:hypothetical protein
VEYNGYKPGYIYVLKSGPYYKIGYADNVEQRLKVIGNAAKPDDLTEPIELLFSFETTSKMIAERTLHEFFSRFRVKGEWFRLGDRHVESLRGFTETSVDEFCIQLHSLPNDVILYTREDIEFAKRYNLRMRGSEEGPEDLDEAIEKERSRRGRAQRAEHYRDALSSLLKHMSVEDLEWIYRAIMRRGVSESAD